ncbi:MAG: hypothetical protein QOJ84_1867 [Bradyrhizobium sp.]|jgi:hypothetical protein|nr:hypothetical protein [Bradyrhizobium sp.]
MVTEALSDRKIDASEELAQELMRRGSPLLAAYWEFREELGGWRLVLVPTAAEEEPRLIKEATDLLVEAPYRSTLSIFDSAIDSRQIDRARALGAYIRTEPYIGQRFDTTFTGRQYFESVVPVYLAPELMTHFHVA